MYAQYGNKCKFYLFLVFRSVCVHICGKQLAGAGLASTPLNTNARCLASNRFPIGNPLMSAIPLLPMISMVAFRMFYEQQRCTW